VKRKILSIGLAAVLAAALTAVAATPALAASAPTTSPAAASRVFQWNQDFNCESGYACATVPYAGGYYIFKFYYYGTYSLSNWLNIGIAFNDQTNAAAMRLRDGNGTQVECIRGQIDGVAHFDDWVDWNPIWRIQLTSSGC
jgi:hypothetical protein